MFTKALMPFFIFLLFLGACEEDDDAPNNQVISEEYVEGVFYATYNNGINIEIKTNAPATFASVTGRNTIAISETGSATGNYNPDLYWVQVLWEDGAKELLPILITTHPEQAKRTIQALSEMDTHSDGYVLVLRHANADVGDDAGDNAGIADWWKSCDPEIARQIGDVGRTRAALISDAFRKLNIHVALGISSEFCRAKQTLELIELDFPTQVEGRLNHESHYTSPNSAYENLEDIILENPQENGILIVVGHSNLKDNNPYIDYIHPFNMYDGFLMEKDGDQLSFIGYVPFEYWRLF